MNNSQTNINLLKNHTASALFSLHASTNKITYDLNTLKEINKNMKPKSSCVYGDTDSVFYLK